MTHWQVTAASPRNGARLTFGLEAADKDGAERLAHDRIGPVLHDRSGPWLVTVQPLLPPERERG